MEGTIWKDLLDQLGCLDNGRFAAPKSCREVFISGPSGRGPAMALQCGKQPPKEWSYTEDFVIYDDGRRHRIFYAWYNVESVNVNEA